MMGENDHEVGEGEPPCELSTGVYRPAETKDDLVRLALASPSHALAFGRRLCRHTCHTRAPGLVAHTHPWRLAERV